MAGEVNVIGAVIIGVVSSGGLWTLLQFILNRAGRRAEAGRQLAAAEKDQQDARKAEAERLLFIQQVERTAYDRAIAAADERVGEVKEKCSQCLSELATIRSEQIRERMTYELRISNLEQSNYALIDAALEIVPLLDADAEHTRALRAAVRTARQARYRYGSNVEEGNNGNATS